MVNFVRLPAEKGGLLLREALETSPPPVGPPASICMEKEHFFSPITTYSRGEGTGGYREMGNT